MPVQHALIAEKTFTAQLISEGSWGARDIGNHESTMSFFLTSDGYGFIEWDIPDIETTEQIGLWFENGNVLTDYDGVFSLPKEAIELLRSNGFVVGEDFE